MEKKQVVTPYNFVPLWDTVILRYPNEGALPPHNKQDPSLLHGEITVTITAQTPIFISDGDKTQSEFVKDGKTPIIPGSSLRGLIRNNMQILGFGCIAKWNDYRNDRFRNGDFLSQGVPEAHLKSEKGMDYPRSILGFVFNGASAKKEEGSYKSRVSFLDCCAVNNPTPENGRINPWFRSPRITSFREYAIPTNTGFRMRGVKQYWLQQKISEKAAWYQPDGNMHPLPAGSVFRGSIRYHNLHPDELGLLLWCLRLEDGCFQSLGMGKPYGFGRVRVEVTRLTEYRLETLYSGLVSQKSSSPSPAERVDELIRFYRSFAYSKLHPQEADPSGTKHLQEAHIPDFLYMKKTVRTDSRNVRYMRSEEFYTADIPISTVAEIRKKMQKGGNGTE